jgi:flagellar motor switch protein FliM
MSGMMDNDAVAALVEAARRGDVPADAERPVARRTRVRKVDFTRPAKFSADQERRVARVLDTFCRTASTRLSAELRMPIDLELINTAQLTWANAHAQLPENAICGNLVASPIGTHMLLGAELQLVLSAIERLLGGAGDELPPERKLTEIDWVVARSFFQRLVTQLSVVMTDAAEVALELESLESHLDAEVFAGVSEPTLSATIEVRHDDTSSTVGLLIPHAAFAPMADAFTAATADGAGANADPAAVEAAMTDVDVVVHAEVAALDLPVEAVLSIKPGDTLRLGGSAAGGVSLTVGGVPVCRAAPGRMGPRRAVQVSSAAEPPR